MPIWLPLRAEVARGRIDRQEDRFAREEELVDGELQLGREILRVDDGQHVEVVGQAVGRGLDRDDVEGLFPLADHHWLCGIWPLCMAAKSIWPLQRQAGQQAELAAVEQLRLVEQLREVVFEELLAVGGEGGE